VRAVFGENRMLCQIDIMREVCEQTAFYARRLEPVCWASLLFCIAARV